MALVANHKRQPGTWMVLAHNIRQVAVPTSVYVQSSYGCCGQPATKVNPLSLAILFFRPKYIHGFNILFNAYPKIITDFGC